MSVTAFAIAAGQNTGDQHDATGAFIPGAHKFAKAYGCPWRSFDNTGSNATVRKRFYDTIDTYCPAGLSLFAYFGHGIGKGLASAHVYTEHLDDLLKVLKPKISYPFFAVLYACSSGKADGFTGKLREKFGGDAVWVYGHTTAGHSFMNPDVSEEATGNSPTWRMLYPVGSELRSPWAEALKYTDLWARFPMMDDGPIAAEVNARRLLGTWEVKGSGPALHYVFDTAYTAWTQDSGRDYDAPPTGTVKATDAKNKASAVDKGTWTITDRVTVTWESGPTEFWALPLRVVGQQGLSAGSTFTAKRLSHTLGHGQLQG